MPIEDSPGAPRELEQVATIEPDALKRCAGLSQLQRDCSRILDSVGSVVGVDENRTELRKRFHEIFKGLKLGVVRHDVAVAHRAEHRNSILLPGQQIGGTVKASDEARPG